MVLYALTISGSNWGASLAFELKARAAVRKFARRRVWVSANMMVDGELGS
jgi:hypothetical protein